MIAAMNMMTKAGATQREACKNCRGENGSDIESRLAHVCDLQTSRL